MPLVSPVSLMAKFTRRTLVQFFLRNFTIPVIPDDLAFVHGIGFLHEQALKLMPDNPEARNPDVLMHSRRHRADHPAVTVAAANLLSDCFCRLAVPQLVPALLIQITHDLFILGTVAGHHIAVWINKEGIKTHIAG